MYHANRHALLLGLVSALLALPACYAGHLAPEGGPDAGAEAEASRPDAEPPPPPDAAAEDGRGPAPDAAPPPPPACGDEPRRAPLVYYGTREPTYVPLSPGQVLAIGTFGGCSGTLVAPSWVLSARHCGLSVGDAFCMGTEPAAPDTCLPVAEVAAEPGGNDMVLARLSEDATAALPGVEPIPWMDAPMDASWVGRRAEAAGYGQQEDGSSGEREFTAQPIVDVADPYLTIDGEGVRGVCFGDSGGPVMVVADDGTVRVAGALSFGDGSCVGRDTYTRTDVFADWIMSLIGPPAVDGASGCGTLTAEGRCLSGRAAWCEDGVRRTEDCPVRCGWSADAGGFRCIEGADPCEGVDGVGRCEDGVARWCEAGTPRRRDCSACGERCVLDPAAGGATCEPDPCMGLDYLGRCNGDVAEYCADGELRRRDCAAEGRRCRWVNDEIGYWCR